MFLQRLKLATLNLVFSLGFPKPIIKSRLEENVAWPITRKVSQNFRFPYNISAKAGASDFIFGAQLGFVKTHHKITCKRKGGCDHELGELPKIWGSLKCLHDG